MKVALLAIALVLAATFSMAGEIQEDLSNFQINKNLSSMPMAFTVNQGQWDEKISFRSSGNGATMWFASDGAYYQFNRIIEGAEKSVDDPFRKEPKAVETMMIKANFVGSNLSPTIVGLNELDYKCNYFLGNDQSKWATDVPNYAAVMYEQVYDGIDLKYYGNGTQMEYDFIVKPGVDYSQIKIEYQGAESIAVNDNGELVIKTKWNEVIEQRPVVYQIENNKRIAVVGEYKLKGGNSFGFELQNYNSELPLVIDPVLSYSTFLGGVDRDRGDGIAVDASGAAYITGWTPSTNFPTFNPLLGTYQGGTQDVFVTKLSSSGNSLVFSTYLGGNNVDWGDGITIDSSGAIYLAGLTSSTNFPTLNPYQATYQGGNYDIYVTKLSSSGNSLIYSTYLGGSDWDSGYHLAVDKTGAVYVTGRTNSADFPLLNPYQGTMQSWNDNYVTKLNSSGNGLIYSTYLGGNGDDYGLYLIVDSIGEVYLAGATSSTDFPTLNPIQATFGGGVFDATITKLNSSGNGLIYSTYLGGTDTDVAEGIAVDATGAAYITGSTSSTDYPVLNPYQASGHGFSDVILSKINPTGNSLIYSTYFGGGDYETGMAIAIDTSGEAVYIAGYGQSVDYPTLNPYQGTNQGGQDIYATKFNSADGTPIYSTYLGGSDDDFAYGAAVDNNGAFYITGYTKSTDFPTLNAYQGSYQGGTGDIIITKLIDSAAGGCCIDPTGDINNDGGTLADISDLLFLVDYMFLPPGTAPEPVCMKEADVNGDGGTAPDISDLLYLVDYMFLPPGTSPAPADCL